MKNKGDNKMLNAAGAGIDRLSAEADRIRKIKASAHPSGVVGFRIIAAPARGACVVVPNVAMVADGVDQRGQTKWRDAAAGSGYPSAIRGADIFDKMIGKARRAHEPDPLTPGQIAQARMYRALVEQHEAGGMKLSSIEGRVSGGSGRDFMDAFMAVGHQVEGMRRRIGSGSSMQVRRIRPSARGSRRSIPDRAIVDMICLGDHSVSEVLKAHGWAAKGDTRKALIAALAGALDRMIGYRG